jgi:hypothetical protein
MTTTDQFKQKFGKELYELLFSVFYGDTTSPDIEIIKKRRIDAINYDFEASIVVGDELWYVSCSDGNNGGSEVNDWDRDPIKLSNTISTRSFAPAYQPGCSPEQKLRIDQIFALRMQSEEYKKQIRDMNYDYMFSPTTKIDEHYRAWATARQLSIIHETIKIDD